MIPHVFDCRARQTEGMLTYRRSQGSLLVFQNRLSANALDAIVEPSIPQKLGIQLQDADIVLEESVTVSGGDSNDRPPALSPEYNADRMPCEDNGSRAMAASPAASQPSPWKRSAGCGHPSAAVSRRWYTREIPASGKCAQCPESRPETPPATSPLWRGSHR